MIVLNFLLASLVFLLCYDQGQTYNIIHISPFASTSHKNAFDPLIMELANRGHNVTVVSSFTYPKTKNINEILLEKSNVFTSSTFQKYIFNYVGAHPLLGMLMFKDLFVSLCRDYLENSKTKQLIKEGKQFDVVILSVFLTECTLASATLLGKNIILQSPAGFFAWGCSNVVPQPPSYVANFMLPYTNRMTFFQRLNNVITTLGVDFMYTYLMEPAIHSEVLKHLPDSLYVTEARRLVSLFITNADPVLISPRPGMPDIVNVGGMHCRNAKPLPKELEDFVKGSGEDGFIYFSLGSNAQSRYLPDEVKKSLLDVFSRLKQRVIWKYEEELEKVPDNIKIIKWAPQQDILGHPKIRIFITHGGLLSMQESVYHAVPVVAVPLFGDQGSNIARVVELEIGIKVDFNNISGASVFEAVNKILSNNNYKENMVKYSAIFRDRKPHPIQLAASSVEYVVKHEGAWHLKSAAENLNFFQYFLLDVIAFILVILITVIGVLVFIGNFTFKKVFKKKNTKELKKKEQ